jgi:hypothetical protein
MSTRNILGIFLGVKGGRRVGLTTLWASTACYRDGFAYFLLVFLFLVTNKYEQNERGSILAIWKSKTRNDK